MRRSTSGSCRNRRAPSPSRSASSCPASLDKTFVYASAEPSEQFQSYAEAARRDPSWRYLEVPATHWLMYTHPHEVAAIILDPDHA